MDRAQWIRTVRARNEERMDEIFSPIYDSQWGAVIDRTHARMVRYLLDSLPAGSRILDAACGTGKYWPMLRTAGMEIVGIDQSAGML